MRARTRVVVGPRDDVVELACEPPLTVRRVHGPGCSLCLVGSAAGPLPGDDLGLRLVVGAGADVSLRAAGASIAQGRDDRPRPAARLRYDVVVGPGARLVADPGALVVTASADVVVDVRLDLAVDADVRWTETVVLGRVGQPAGRAVLRWTVCRGGEPLLRQDVDLADPAVAAWIGTTGAAKVLTTSLHTAPDLVATTVVRSPTDVTQALTDRATLTTRLS